MRALAQFITRGRTQAGIVAFFGNLLPFISPATVSLVVLTKGLPAGALLSLYAVTPLLLMYIYGNETNSIIIILSFFTIGCVFLASNIMRSRSSWSHTLIFIIIFSAISAMLLPVFFTEKLVALELIIGDFFKDTQQYEEKFIIGRSFLLGVASYIVALTSIVSLILGRWWQAMLYNPGGFKSEFHQLRFSTTFSVIILAVMLICEYLLKDFTSWTSLLGLPLMLSGIALLHYGVALFQLGSYWLVTFYLALLFLSPLSIMLVGLGFLDSIFNIRSRLNRYS